MLYEVNFDNAKNIKLNENIFNCSIKIAILNKTFNAGLIKEKRYLELKQNILQESGSKFHSLSLIRRKNIGRV